MCIGDGITQSGSALYWLVLSVLNPSLCTVSKGRRNWSASRSTQSFVPNSYNPDIRETQPHSLPAIFTSSTYIRLPRLHRALHVGIDRYPSKRTIFPPPSSTYSSYRLQIAYPAGFQAAYVSHVSHALIADAAELAAACPLLPDNPDYNDNNEESTVCSHRPTTCIITDVMRVILRAEMSHALIDGTGLQTFVRELATAYQHQ
ncbi:hypothetical protein P153DRAFT_397151 [Dothidotthia symphoricarpi CBS 119687]|uniref:Uncharacterized protein n=1 Tax=Dothidotthia symphoricarpi CBS 119687 TaxID=1392245 RepID=A0A6A6ABI1_9PLEO|nr:uncharacterized protein P153DRAFT_397151 [Dothidotthia symphoricarpi CBS 119687]KAF2128936.1 hypothetical protein P153DRAFT_397151 [Dothidotthia symphoricarpi CBS 119687]